MPDVSTPPEPPAELNLINLPTTTSLNRHQSYFRLDAPVRARPAARRLQLAGGGLLQPRQRRGHRPGVPIRHHQPPSGRRPPHDPQQDDSVHSGRYDACAQGDALPVGLSITGSIEGLANFHQNYQPGFAVTVSRTRRRRARTLRDARRSSPTPAPPTRSPGTRITIMATSWETSTSTTVTTARPSSASAPASGSGRRLRRRRVLAACAGHDPGRGTWGVAIEKQTAGHTLQLNFTNSFGTTLGEIARGGSPHDVYLGST